MSPADDTVGDEGVLVTVTCGATLEATVAESCPDTGPPPGSVAPTVTVLCTAPASMSACVTAYVHEYVHVSPASNNPSLSVSPPCNAGAHNGSVTDTPDSVWLPSLTTATE